PAMRTNGLVFIDDSMLPQLRQDQAPEQVANVATMPGILGAAMAMPDIHWGYGFPIGGVAAFDHDDGVISPGGIGYDINCGVRLVRTNLVAADVRAKLRALTDACFENVPSGVGEGGMTKVTRQDLAKPSTDGVGWSGGRRTGRESPGDRGAGPSVCDDPYGIPRVRPPDRHGLYRGVRTGREAGED